MLLDSTRSTFSSVRTVQLLRMQGYSPSLRQQLLPGQQLQQPRRLGLRHLGQLGQDPVAEQERQDLHGCLRLPAVRYLGSFLGARQRTRSHHQDPDADLLVLRWCYVLGDGRCLRYVLHNIFAYLSRRAHPYLPGNGRFDQGIKQALLTAAGQSGSNPPPPPPSGSHQIHPNGNTGKCLDVQGGVMANGTPVQM